MNNQFPPQPFSENDDNRHLPLSAEAQSTAISTNVNTLYGGGKEQESNVNLREYWQVVVKHKWTVITFLLMVMAVGVVATFLTTPIYRASTVLQIERESTKVMEFEEIKANDSRGADFYQTQYELLKSRSLAERVVEQLGLVRQPNPTARKDKSLIEWFFELLDGSQSQATVSSLAMKEVSLDEIRISQARALLSGLVVEPVRNSRLVRVSFDSPDPQKAALVANAIAQNFINLNMERKFEATSYAKSFLEDRISQVKERLEQTEKAMLEYARDNGIVNLGGTIGGTTVSRNLEGFNEALSAAKQERIKAESLYRQLQSTYSGDLPQLLESSIIKSLRENKVKLESEYQDKLSTYRPGHPSMLELNARILEIDTQIIKERKVISESIRASYEAVKAHEFMISEQFNAAKADVIQLQTSEIQYNILKREADTNRTLYDGLLQRYRELGVVGTVGNNNITVVDRAEVPKAYYKPNLELNLLIALLIGLAGGIGLAFLFEHLDDSFKRAKDIEDLLGLPVFGLIPDSEEMKNGATIVDVSLDNPKASIVEAYRSVRTALQFSGENGAPKVMAISSSEKGESKTTSSVALGIQFAQFGSRVLIIDADLRNPTLHKVFGGSNQLGLTNVLAGGESPVEVTNNTPVSNLYFMASGPLPPNPAELLSGHKMLELIELARTKFDYVIIDSPPILGLADVIVIAKLADAVLLQIRSGSTHRAAVQQALKRLANVRIRPLGCILTRVRHNMNGYGYEYDYYYSYGDHEHGGPKPPTQVPA